jgi:hypothetical protein
MRYPDAEKKAPQPVRGLAHGQEQQARSFLFGALDASQRVVSLTKDPNLLRQRYEWDTVCQPH